MPTGREWLNMLPYGGAINGFRDGGFRGGMTGLWNGSMPGRATNFFRGLGDGVQGNGLAGLMGHGYSPYAPGTGGLAGPPTAAEQYGVPGSPDFVGPPEAGGGSGGGWMDWIAEHLSGMGGGGGGRPSGNSTYGGGVGNARAAVELPADIQEAAIITACQWFRGSLHKPADLKLESGDAADVVDGSIASPPCATDTSDPMAARTLPATGMPTICCPVLGSE